MLRVRLGLLLSLLCLMVLAVVLVMGVSGPEAIAQTPAGSMPGELRLGSAQAEVTSVNLDLVVSQSYDDAEEDIATGLVTQRGTDLELGVDDLSAQAVGLRFALATIPQGALIVEAQLEFTADETGSVPTSLVVHGEASDDAADLFARWYQHYWAARHQRLGQLGQCPGLG